MLDVPNSLIITTLREYVNFCKNIIKNIKVLKIFAVTHEVLEKKEYNNES